MRTICCVLCWAWFWLAVPLLASPAAPLDAVIDGLQEQAGQAPAPGLVVSAALKKMAEPYRRGDYQAALALAQATLPYTEQHLGKDHPQTLTIVNDLAAFYHALGRYGAAEPLYRRARATRERVLGVDHPETLTSVNGLAKLYHDQGRYGEAESLFNRVLPARERVLGENHPETLTSVNGLARLYHYQGRYGEAESLFNRVLPARERVLGENHPETLTSVNNLAELYGYQGRYGEAAPLFRFALATRERVLGVDHPDTLDSANYLAVLYWSQGRYGEAEPLYRRVLAARERVLGVDHPETLTSINYLALLYRDQGRYGEAEPLFRRALAARERVLGVDHPHTLASVNNLALLYRSRGRYGEAEPLYRRALAIRERVLGVDNHETLVIVNNLALLYRSQGRYDEAESLLRRVLATNERVLGEDHPNTLESVSSLAVLYRDQGRYDEAEPLLRRAMTVSEQVLGKDHPETLLRVNNLAVFYRDQGIYGKAEPLLRRVVTASQRLLGVDHPDTLGNANDLAVLYRDQGRYDEAEPLLRRTLVDSERALGKDHPRTLEVRMNLVMSRLNLGNVDLALLDLRRLDEDLRGYVGGELTSTLKESVKRHLLVSQSTLQDVVYTLAVTLDDRDARRLAADVLLRWKRFAGEAEAGIARLARTNRDPRIVAAATDVDAARASLSRAVHLPNPNPDQLHQLHEALDTAERELAQLSAEFAAERRHRAVTWESVRDALPAGSALLELRLYRPVNFTTGKSSPPHWLALLMPADPEEGPELLFQDLGPIDNTRTLVDRFRAEPTNRAIGTGLYCKLFCALYPVISAFSTLYLAPDGELNLVALGALRLPSGEHWVERQALRQIRTGRHLIPRPSAAAGVGLLALGGVDYDRFGESNGKPSTVAVLAEDDSRALAESRERLRQSAEVLPHLPHTRLEVDAITQRYRDVYGHRPTTWIAAEASEQRLKALRQAPRIVHLATHGFFLDALETRTERPLTLSGLALAGANRGMKGDYGPADEDGVLYALEAQALGLEGTELVTLSACDTGRGEVDYSEGVYGLVRAFHTAGAKNVLMSLWPIDDALAKDFMTEFYQHLFDPANRSPHQALRKTQLAWIASNDPTRASPGYWAPYVLVERN